MEPFVRRPIILPCGPIYDVIDVADLLKTSRRTIQRLIQHKRLKAYKIGRSYRILARDLEAFFTQPAQAPPD
jgi:excisionase family DNA binding protein